MLRNVGILLSVNLIHNLHVFYTVGIVLQNQEEIIMTHRFDAFKSDKLISIAESQCEGGEGSRFRVFH